ncbi:MAG: type II toxin-antitoxin system RelE/ParE family toxin [Lachnospiraceae bacterium]|nr:type II toxin-antitoxin system RelE/ParE family toxin [Lachnospiraceae bacterium]
MASDCYNYVLTESAEADIDEALDYIANELVNPDAASAFADELEEKENIVVLRVVYNRRDQDKILKTI